MCGGASTTLRASGRARRGGHGVGGPRGLPSLPRHAEVPAPQVSPLAPPRGSPGSTQGPRLQPPHAKTMDRAQTQAASTTFHTYRLSRRISVLDLTLRIFVYLSYLFSPI